MTFLCWEAKTHFPLPADTNALVNARVMRDKQTGVSQGFAFLEFTTRPAAQQVLSKYDGKHIHANLVLRLNWAAFGLGRSSEGIVLKTFGLSWLPTAIESSRNVQVVHLPFIFK